MATPVPHHHPVSGPAISYFVITNIIFVFIGLFALVYSITRGGPGYETTPIDYMIYIKAFAQGSLGYASALAVILLILVLIISWMQITLFDRVGAE
ncbi:hypothetical protein [Dictyobacter kobayashii]|uniref:ABC transmembrane type-1 domain-containing protein n=1 Tax=Dictyobacter kobayashii TaxID=2014872 RepID=A0A402ASW2_9CHLR|nr:hypothetical protein [Dictyobacter kobayashii]GCE22187.1 hypothetical protein KDK_59870 [Dictyobacter kobayashii]